MTAVANQERLMTVLARTAPVREDVRASVKPTTRSYFVCVVIPPSRKYAAP